MNIFKSLRNEIEEIEGVAKLELYRRQGQGSDFRMNNHIVRYVAYDSKGNQIGSGSRSLESGWECGEVAFGDSKIEKAHNKLVKHFTTIDGIEVIVK